MFNKTRRFRKVRKKNNYSNSNDKKERCKAINVADEAETKKTSLQKTPIFPIKETYLLDEIMYDFDESICAFYEAIFDFEEG